MAKSVKFALDFKVAEEEDLYTLDIPLRFQIHTSGTIHGLAFWFDVAFIGSFTTVWVCPFKNLEIVISYDYLHHLMINFEYCQLKKSWNFWQMTKNTLKISVKTDQIYRFPIKT